MPYSSNAQQVGSKKTRKKHSSEFKFNRVIEAIKKGNMSEISRQYGIGVNVLSEWKTRLMTQGKTIFENAPDKEVKELKSKIAKLEQMIGKKEIEMNLLKNFSDFYESQNTT
jgi:transposase